MSLTTRAKPAARRLRKAADKPPMPAHMEASAAKAIKRHQRRLLSPGVAVEVAKVGDAYVVASPHQDRAAWEAMVCDALGTRSLSTTQTFLDQLSELCSQNWHPSEVEGEYGQWCPDERELNMILNMVAEMNPRNALEAAQAAQMVAVHLMTMRVSARALSGAVVTAQDAALAGKLARTFVMQAEGLAKLRGRQPAKRQTITVRHDKHIHNHQHVYFEGGGSEHGGQACEPSDGHDGGNNCAAPRVEHERCAALPGTDSSGVVVPMPRNEGQEPVSDSWRGKRIGSAEGDH